MQSSGLRNFQGTFNGLGHTVANVHIKGQGGIFGQMNGATVENVAFVGIQKSGDWYVLCNQCNGTNYVRNVYIEGLSNNGETIIFRPNAALYVENVIANIKNLSTTKKNITFWELEGNASVNVAKMKNNYAIGDFSGVEYSGNKNGATLCANVAAFATADTLATITAANGWNMDIWSVQSGALYFGNRAVQDITYTTYGQVTLP
jgi:hypothetical protein